MTLRSWLSLFLLLPSVVLAQTPGTFVGTSTNPSAPNLSASALNAAFATKLDYAKPLSINLSAAWATTSVPNGTSLIFANGNQSGTLPSGAGVYGAWTLGIPNDTVAAAGNSSGFHGLVINHNIGTGATGGRTSLQINTNQNGTISGGSSFFIDGINSWVTASAPVTGGGGNIIAMSPQTIVTAAATGYALAELSEGNLQTNAPIAGRVGEQIFGGGTYQGSSYDFAYGIIGIAGMSTAPWKIGLSYGNPINAWGIDPAGTMIGTMPQTNGGAQVIPQRAAYGADFRRVNFTTAAFASPGFSVDFSGAISTGAATFAVSSAGAILDVNGYAATSATVSVAGAGYTALDQLYDTVGGILQVDTVNGSGNIMTLHYLRPPYWHDVGAPATTALSGGTGNQAAVANLTWTLKTTLAIQPSAGPITINNIAAVSCAAGTVSLATLVVTNGMITHC